ncbi:MAG: ferritin-like domain-containing protein [Proteobacteria bacterium]|jgi:uncharacterized ferritin-like protein (DUF455 family)|nr:ferritin-like domain-containing protein [Pseudomonadota bacterium]
MSIEITCVRQKLAHLEESLHQSLTFQLPRSPFSPGRDIRVLKPEDHPDKKGLSSKEGQARLLHDLASIELQAMELGLRTLRDFPEAPRSFREELAGITLSEGRHLELCLNGLEKLGFQWGHWPVHTLLWHATDSSDSLLDRILIVHRYLEGSGLDAGDTLLRRLDGVLESPLHHITKTIFTEEVGHVEFGSRWYREVCQSERTNPEEDFPRRMNSLRHKIPKRIEPLAIEARKKAGFSDSEIGYLQNLRDSMRKASQLKTPLSSHPHLHSPQDHTS